MDTTMTAGGGGAEEPAEAVPGTAAGGSAPQEPADVSEPALGGPKDDPQEAIATHSGMWWPPAVQAEPGETETSEEPADAAGDPPPAEA
jgi:hypothetical protein